MDPAGPYYSLVHYSRDPTGQIGTTEFEFSVEQRKAGYIVYHTIGGGSQRELNLVDTSTFFNKLLENLDIIDENIVNPRYC